MFRLLLCVLVGLLSFSEVVASDFNSPLPPPELGRTLTDYRTDMQKQEQNSKFDIRNNKHESNKNSTVYNGDNAIDTGKSYKRVMPERIKNKDYAPNSCIFIVKNGEAIIEVFDSQHNPLEITNYEVGNSGFVGRKLVDNELLITPTGKNTASKIKVFIKGKKTPLYFIVKSREFSASVYRTVEEVTVNLARLK